MELNLKQFNIRKAINDETRERVDVILFDHDGENFLPVTVVNFPVEMTGWGGRGSTHLLNSVMTRTGNILFELRSMSGRFSRMAAPVFFPSGSFRLVKQNNSWYFVDEKVFDLNYTLEKEEENSTEETSPNLMGGCFIDPSILFRFTDNTTVDLFSETTVDYLSKPENKEKMALIRNVLELYFKDPLAKTDLAEKMSYFVSVTQNARISKGLLPVVLPDKVWKEASYAKILFSSFNELVYQLAVENCENGLYSVYRYTAQHAVVKEKVMQLIQLYSELKRIELTSNE